MSGEIDLLIEEASRRREMAYAPYSGFKVGAAILTRGGEIFGGCNVENLSYGLTICAERSAVGAAVSAGYVDFERIAIVAGSREPVSPCGACRQVLAEFGDFLVVSVSGGGERFEMNVSELLPRAKTGILDRDG